MLEQFLQYDTDLFLILNGLGTPAWDGFWMFYTTKFNWIPLYALLLFLIYRKVPLKTFLMIVVLVAVLVLFTDQVTNLFKYGIQRLRPCHNEHINEVVRLVKSSCGGRFGFFSGHSSNTMAIAVFTGLLLKGHYKYLLFILLFWAVLMGYSRIYIGVHYPLDVLCGMIFGALSGWMFLRIWLWASQKIRI